MKRILFALAVLALTGAGCNSVTAPSGPLFTRSGVGNTIFFMGSSVKKLHVTASYAGNSSNFIVWVGPINGACDVSFNTKCHLIVNELVGTGWNAPNLDAGIVATGGGDEVTIASSTGVSWTMTEVR